MLKILIGSLLALTAANSVAGNKYIYKSNTGKVLLTNVSERSDSFFIKTNTTAVKHSENIDDLAAEYAASIKKLKSNDMYTPPVQSSKPTTSDSMKSALKFEVPEGYRLPTKADIVSDWKRFDAPNHIKADFNGDGIEDEAYILPKKDSIAGYGVFVSLNNSKVALQRGRKFQMFKLTDSDDMSPQSFAIELAEPSNEIWKSACGKGYWECEVGEPSAFKINHPSIMFCYIESACTMYMWDSKRLTFKEIKFSD